MNEEAIVIEEEPKDEIVIMEEKEEEPEENISEITEVAMPEEETMEIELEDKEELEEYDTVADDLEKTHFFRIIPVDEGELDSTLLEIANYEVNEQNRNDNKNKKTNEEIIDSVEDEEADLSKVDLNLIKKHTVVIKFN